MKILAIDTTALIASVAIVEDDKLLVEYTINHKMTHSQTIMPMIDEVKKMLDLDLRTIDYIACSSGPGSFTGLRIGASTAKGLAHGLNISIVPVPTLDALAYNIFETDKIICPIMDARRQQVYSALYKWDLGKLVRLTDYMADDINVIMDKAKSISNKVIFLGDGTYVHKDMIIQNNFDIAPSSLCLQRAASVAAFGKLLVEDGKAINSFDFLPVYLRKPQAERELEERKAGGNNNA